jgi:hypothetical protein
MHSEKNGVDTEILWMLGNCYDYDSQLTPHSTIQLYGCLLKICKFYMYNVQVMQSL